MLFIHTWLFAVLLFFLPRTHCLKASPSLLISSINSTGLLLGPANSSSVDLSYIGHCSKYIVVQRRHKVKGIYFQDIFDINNKICSKKIILSFSIDLNLIGVQVFCTHIILHCSINGTCSGETDQVAATTYLFHIQYKPTVQAIIQSVMINQINTFNLSRTCYQKNLSISKKLMHPAYFVNQNLPSIHGLDKVMQQYNSLN